MRRHGWLLLALFACSFVPTGSLVAQKLPTPYWIWTPEEKPGRVDQGSCYFRKTIQLPAVESGQLRVAADDSYEVLLNGERLGDGQSWEEFQVFDLDDHLKEGANTVAIKVTNRNGSTAGLAAIIELQLADGKRRVYVTNPTWKTNQRVLPLWGLTRYRDSRWKAARNLGPYGKTKPWIIGDADEDNVTAHLNPASIEGIHAANKREKTLTETPSANADEQGEKSLPFDDPVTQPDNNVATKPSDTVTPTNDTATQATDVAQKDVAQKKDDRNVPQFSIPSGFRIEHIIGGERTGPLVAMAFNEFGQIIVSRENGPLLLIFDRDKDGRPEKPEQCCEKVTKCQGILSVSGLVFVVGEGPEGAGLYRLDDADRDSFFEKATLLVAFEGDMSEHGPHGLTLSPDGNIYFTIGNHTKVTTKIDQLSPIKNTYEGDLVGPKFEDPRGHAEGIKKPGGSVYRISQDGKRLQHVASGLRNAYDLAFNDQGELFLHDSDMESDEGLPWHRPTRMMHIIPGGEYGWRSGWSKWPDYLVDVLPGVADTGRGSPTGIIAYEDDVFPPKYHGRLFSCDWARGRIVSFRMRRKGAGYVGEPEVFLKGKPLNVTDIDVGPDGALYFCTGGRGTAGDIYRVVSSKSFSSDAGDKLAPKLSGLPLNTAFGRQKLAILRRDMGPRWDRQIREILLNENAPSRDRLRAVDLMHLIGPPPTDDLLIQLSRERNEQMQAKACGLLGIIANDVARDRLLELLSDPSAFVRRHACEALARSDTQVSVEKLQPLLESTDRFESWAARRLLQRNRSTDWHRTVMATSNTRFFLQGALAMMVDQPNNARALQVVDRSSQLTRKFVSDREFIDLLRLIQVAIMQGSVSTQDAVARLSWISEEFPAGNVLINRELVKLLVFTQEANLEGRFVEYLESDVPNTEKINLVMQLSLINGPWQSESTDAILAYMEKARGLEYEGQNVHSYLQSGCRSFLKHFPESQLQPILSKGNELPNSVVDALFALPEKVNAESVEELANLYRKIAHAHTSAHDRLRTGIIAVLGSSQQTKAMAYLREVYDRDPERRQMVAIALAQEPSGRNWDYLVRSLPILEGEFLLEAITKLQGVEYAPESPEHYRQVILAGIKDPNLAAPASILLQHWTGLTAVGETDDVRIMGWQRWFEKEYPNHPSATVPIESANSSRTLEDLVTFLESEEGQQGSVVHGQTIFEAKCANCHRLGRVGVNIGPDLTGIGQRFQRREILESIVHPSQVISDRFSSKTVTLSDGRSFNGLLNRTGDGQMSILLSSGRTQAVATADIEETLPSKISAMPTGLLEGLSLGEISDLILCMMQPFEPATAGPSRKLR